MSTKGKPKAPPKPRVRKVAGDRRRHDVKPAPAVRQPPERPGWVGLPVTEGDAATAFGKPCGLFELGADQCHWIWNEPTRGKGDALYCAAETAEGAPYCPTHARVAFRGGTYPDPVSASARAIP